MSEDDGRITPTTPAEPAESGAAEGLEGAGFWIRALARGIDLLVHYTVYFLVTIITVMVAGVIMIIAGGSFDTVVDKLSHASFIGYLGAFLGYLSYSTLAEGLHGSTLGKLICGLTVIKQDETYCDLRAGLKRSLAFYVDGLFFGIPAAVSMVDDRQKRRIGDRWAKTMVVKRRMIEERLPKRSGLRFVLSLFLGVMLDGAFISAALFIKALS